MREPGEASAKVGQPAEGQEDHDLLVASELSRVISRAQAQAQMMRHPRAHDLSTLLGLPLGQKDFQGTNKTYYDFC